jgi:hypothetical protein
MDAPVPRVVERAEHIHCFSGYYGGSLQTIHAGKQPIHPISGRSPEFSTAANR